MENRKVKVQVTPNGPYLISGEITLVDRDGIEISKEGSMAFCRCGGSGNKPFCDGTHKKINFNG